MNSKTRLIQATTAALGLVHFPGLVSAQVIDVGYTTTSAALPYTSVQGSEKVLNGSFETHTDFAAYLATSPSPANLAAVRGPRNGQDGIAAGDAVAPYVGLWANRFGNWANNIALIGLPDNWNTFSNGGNPSTAVTPLLPGVNNAGTYAGSITVTVSNPDLHARWTSWPSDGRGQVGSVPRPVELSKSSMYFGTGATRYGVYSTGNPTVTSFGTPDAEGVYAINPTVGSPGGITPTMVANTTFITEGTGATSGLGVGYAGSAASTSGAGTQLTWVAGSPVSTTSLYQDVTGLLAGRNYRLSFWASTENAVVSTDYSQDPGMFKVTISNTDGTSNAQRIFLQNPGFNETDPKGRFYFIVFTAAATSARLRWDDYGHLDRNLTGGFGINSTAELVLDGVSLVAVPEASTWMALSGLMFGAAANRFWRRRQAV